MSYDKLNEDPSESFSFVDGNDSFAQYNLKQPNQKSTQFKDALIFDGSNEKQHLLDTSALTDADFDAFKSGIEQSSLLNQASSNTSKISHPSSNPVM